MAEKLSPQFGQTPAVSLVINLASSVSISFPFVVVVVYTVTRIDSRVKSFLCDFGHTRIISIFRVFMVGLLFTVVWGINRISRRTAFRPSRFVKVSRNEITPA